MKLGPLLLVLCLLWPSLLLAAKAQAPLAKGELPADAPVRRLQTLLTRKDVSREALRKIEAELEQAKNARPDGLNGAKATFFLARTEQEMGKRSGLKSDWVKAADNFGACAERFPKYQLAPDALLHRGNIRLLRLADPEGARDDYTTLRRLYPSSPHAATAAKMLARIPGKGAAQPAQAKKQEPPAAPQPQPEAAPSGKPQLVDVQPKNVGDSSRVIIELDSRVRYRYQILEHQNRKKGGRIYVDLIGARPRPGLDDDMQVQGGILKHVRVAPKGGDTIRVVMDYAELKDYRVTALDSPFRLVIDGFRSAGLKAATPAPVAAPEEPPQNFTIPKANRKKLAADLVEQLGLSVHTIMIDAGHGGKDPGARGNGLQEKDVTLRMAFVLGKVLKDRGFRVLYTRTTDDFLALEERTALANNKKADLFVSVHCNAHTDPTMHGLETYSLNLAKSADAVRVAARENAVTDKNISDLQMILTDLMLTSKIKESLDLARGVQRQSLSALRDKWTVTDHGNREAPFYVLMGAKMPAVLVEMGYITNKTEAARLKSDNYLRILAAGIADGICEYKQQLERYTTKK